MKQLVLRMRKMALLTAVAPATVHLLLVHTERLRLFVEVVDPYDSLPQMRTSTGLVAAIGTIGSQPAVSNRQMPSSVVCKAQSAGSDSAAGHNAEILERRLTLHLVHTAPRLAPGPERRALTHSETRVRATWGGR